MITLLLVFLGGGFGSLLRYGVNVASLAAFGPLFPWGTLAVNAVGGLAMGAVAGWFAQRTGLPGAAEARLFLMTGVLGGFTTFSAFSLDAVALWERGAVGLALLYVIASVVIAVGGTLIGLALARGVT